MRDELLLVDVVERVGEGHVAVAVMVAVGLAVGGDVDELRMRAPFAERAEEAMREVLAAREQPLEGDGARDRAVVEEDVDATAPTADCSDTASSDRWRRSARSSRPRRSRRQRRACCGSRIVKRDPLRGQRFERVDVDRRLRQPHPLRLAAEAVLEVADAPAHLRALVARVRQRQDHVVVRLRDRRAVAAEALAADAVGVEDRGVRLGLRAAPATTAASARS